MSTERRPLKVFISYASQDAVTVREVYNALKLQDWIDPWLDKAKILPGQEWRLVIEQAVEEADVVIVCLSSQSVTTEGFIQREMKYASDIALEKPEGTIFLIPLRLDPCELPRGFRSLQWVDYFGSDKNNAYANLLDALKLRYEQKIGVLKGVSIRPELIPEKGQVEAEKNATLTEKQRGRRPKNMAGVPSKIPDKGKPKKSSRKLDPTIVAALIGLAGTLLVTLITIYANRSPTVVPTGSPTSTVALTATVTHTPFFTPTVPTETQIVTNVPATHVEPPATLDVVRPVPLAEDWLAGCISTLWKPYPADISVSERGDGCWNEPILRVFSAENGDLDFLAQRGNGPAEIYGLFAPLQATGTVTFTVRLRELNNADLWMGVFAEADVKSDGLLMIVPAGDLRRRVFVQKDPRNYETIISSDLFDLENGFSITFRFTENAVRSTVNPAVFVTNSISVPSSQKWLFLGYKGLRGTYRINGTFLSLELE